MNKLSPVLLCPAALDGPVGRLGGDFTRVADRIVQRLDAGAAKAPERRPGRPVLAQALRRGPTIGMRPL
ncbi:MULTISPECIES: hypothetical protein [Streptomyces]|uniref:hypothetical protein n=1 Tax=Streptomyces TaxID=1883 RepID=UPI00163D1D39|nr:MULTISPECIES: hypothetical protein [Streptomyces]MBC2877609.1 hypothetical protein [Streptomyces sp. TYQ1024]UBI36157.1 hypothetical protein K7I03_06575 [Streptomyces mobaraensis]UKW28752.1 hypothetical protein MCU78_06560 [Streptomyces sp. TYQ1024]